MTGFTKLFESILASSVWAEDDKTRLVWITMLALKNRDHIVSASLPGIANLARVPLEDCERAIKKFESPDPYSRSTDYEGCKIKRVEGGWLVLNGQKYSEMLSYEQRKEYNRKKQAEYRARQKLTERYPTTPPGSPHEQKLVAQLANGEITQEQFDAQAAEHRNGHGR